MPDVFLHSPRAATGQCLLKVVFAPLLLRPFARIAYFESVRPPVWVHERALLHGAAMEL